jgi:hypothetical protein
MFESGGRSLVCFSVDERKQEDIFSCTKNNQLRTGADKGNPTV